MNDSLERFAPGDRLIGSRSTTQFGPVGGATLGVDLLATSYLAFGVQLGAAIQSFGHRPPMLDAAEDIRAHDFGTLTGVSLALNGTFLAGR